MMRLRWISAAWRHRAAYWRRGRVRAHPRGMALVVGSGGWLGAAGALARSGVGRLTLIDLDVVAESNLNWQAHATLANPRTQQQVDAMQERR